MRENLEEREKRRESVESLNFQGEADEDEEEEEEDDDDDAVATVAAEKG